MKNRNNIIRKIVLTAIYIFSLLGTLVSFVAEAKDGVRKKIEVTYIKKSHILLVFKMDKASAYKRSNFIDRRLMKVKNIKVIDTVPSAPLLIL